MAVATTSSSGSLRLALTTIPMLLLSSTMAYAFTMGEPIGPVFDRIYRTGLYDWNGVRVPILRAFYGIPPLDALFARMAIAFAQLQFFADERAYWQSLVFLTDFAGMNAVLHLEACRAMSVGSVVLQYPFLLLFFGQLMGVGTLAPLYFAYSCFRHPADKILSLDFRSMDAASAAAVLPALALAYFSSHFPSFLHPDLEARHWWNWVWQLYPVWGTIIWQASSRAIAQSFPSLGSHASSQKGSLTIVRLTVASLATTSTLMYWYTLASTDLSASEIFVPQYLLTKPLEADVALRTIIQYDQVCSFGSAFLWLAYHFWEMKSADATRISWAVLVGSGLLIGALTGPGATFLLGWLTREEILARRQKDGKSKK